MKYIMLDPYFCTKCGRLHKKPGTFIYARHVKYMRKDNIPVAAIVAVAPMAIDVGKEYVKDPKLIFKPTGMIRAVGRSFGFGKGKAKENAPAFTNFENKIIIN